MLVSPASRRRYLRLVSSADSGNPPCDGHHERLSRTHALDVPGPATVLSSDVKQKLKEALQRGAEHAARNARGVTEVENRLTVDPTVYAGV